MNILTGFIEILLLSFYTFLPLISLIVKNKNLLGNTNPFFKKNIQNISAVTVEDGKG